jgi:hypothetical protein
VIKGLCKESQAVKAITAAKRLLQERYSNKLVGTIEGQTPTKRYSPQDQTTSDQENSNPHKIENTTKYNKKYRNTT